MPATLTLGKGNGRLVASTTRRRTILRPVRCLRALKFRIACLPISRANGMAMRSIISTVQRSAVLISLVCTGGRINDVGPVTRVNTLLTKGGVLFRASTIRTCNDRRVSILRRRVSLLSISTRGVGNPGKVKFLCHGGDLRLPGFVRNNDRRGSRHNNARGAPCVEKFTGTITLVRTRHGRDGHGGHRLNTCFLGKLRGDNIPFRYGNICPRKIPRVLGV